MKQHIVEHNEIETKHHIFIVFGAFMEKVYRRWQTWMVFVFFCISQRRRDGPSYVSIRK
jgi:hypothetical protein